jgi:acetyltransferase-like isoleucine patch superfamily enzyme
MTESAAARVAARAAFDVIVALLFCLLVGVPLTAVGRVAGWAGWLPDVPWWRWALLPPLALAFLCALLLTATLVRLLLPRLKPGRYPFPGHPQSIVWLLHFTLQRLMYLPVWRHLFFAFSTLRWALLRGLGANAAFEMDASSDVLVLDPQLVTVGRGSMLGAGCTLSAHIIERGTLFLGRITIAEGVELGCNVMAAPGVMVGEYAVIGPDCRLAPESAVGPFAYLGASCVTGPGSRIGAHAVIGHQVAIEAGVTVGEGAVVATGTRVPRSTVIAGGAHYPAGAKDAAS